MGAGVAVHLPVNLHGFSVREEDRENYSTRRDYIVKKKKKVGHAVVRMEGKKYRKMLDDVITSMQKKKKESCKFIHI